MASDHDYTYEFLHDADFEDLDLSENACVVASILLRGGRQSFDEIVEAFQVQAFTAGAAAVAAALRAVCELGDLVVQHDPIAPASQGGAAADPTDVA
jgi:hypothetical protein